MAKCDLIENQPCKYISSIIQYLPYVQWFYFIHLLIQHVLQWKIFNPNLKLTNIENLLEIQKYVMRHNSV